MTGYTIDEIIVDEYDWDHEGRLLRCPKCKGEPKTYHSHYSNAWIVICEDCMHEEGHEQFEHEAIYIWNKAIHDKIELGKQHKLNNARKKVTDLGIF